MILSVGKLTAFRHGEGGQRLKSIKISIKRTAALMLLCLVFLTLLCGCAQNTIDYKTVNCTDDEYTAYPDLVAEMLPGYIVDRMYNFVFYSLEKAATAEAFDTQALPGLENNLAKYWYPQYLATVVIAVDRDKTDAVIKGWRDIPAANVEVGFSNKFTDQMLFSAVAYGLEGENFTYKSALGLFADLQAKGHLVTKSFETPIVVCYDFQAAAMKKSGLNIEIIVPCEGTLTYERGLLSKTELSFSGDFDSLLLSAGFRLLDGRCDETLYPDAAAYENANRVADLDHFNIVSQDFTRDFRRNVLHIRLYTSSETREHQYFVLVYMIIVILWIASVIKRAMQKSVQRAALLTGIILMGWILVRLVKWQLDDLTVLGRYLWFSFYIFELALPLVALWLAWAIDRPNDTTPPKWLRVVAMFSGVILLLVFTNDIHNFVFSVDLTSNNWANDYGENFGYTLTRIAYYVPMAAAIVMMLIKSGRNTHKKGVAFPIAFFVLIMLYGFGYSAKIPIARESDITMVTGLLTLLFFESAMRTGIIPVNKKYTALFAHSPLSMQITDSSGNVAYSSASDLRNENDENTLSLTSTITGVCVLWQEDISSLNRLHKDIEISVEKLKTANDLLAEEGKIKRAAQEEIAKTQLLTQLESEITDYMTKLSNMIDKLNSSPDHKETARVALLLCYVKRRCNLFFLERETETLQADELTVYLDEMVEIASYSGVKIILTNELKTPLSVRRATIFYDFFYSVIDWAAKLSCAHILAYLGIEQESVVLRLFPSEDADLFEIEKKLEAATTSAGGNFIIKDLDDAFSLSLSFPEGGVEIG